MIYPTKIIPGTQQGFHNLVQWKITANQSHAWVMLDVEVFVLIKGNMKIVASLFSELLQDKHNYSTAHSIGS